MAKAHEVYEALTNYLVRALKGEPSEKDVEVAERFLRNADVSAPTDADTEGAHQSVLKMSKHRAVLEAAEG